MHRYPSSQSSCCRPILIQQSSNFFDHSVFYTIDSPDLPANVSDVPTFGAFTAQAVALSDPLGRELGSMSSRRILRCSPLTPVAAAC